MVAGVVCFDDAGHTTQVIPDIPGVADFDIAPDGTIWMTGELIAGLPAATSP